MSNPLIKSSHKEIISKRIIGSLNGDENSPTVIIFGGIHGNEPAGIHSLRLVLQKIEEENIKLNGNFYAIAGNLNALRKNIRFETTDLNRIWTDENIANINKPTIDLYSEEKEQLALYQTIKEILRNDKGPFYFIDLHTTSADTIPFITISDSLNNRKFTNSFSIPVVLGIEEYLDGPLLTYINEFGHISLGFEAGQHNEPASIENSEAFIWLSLEASGCINKNAIKKFRNYQQTLTANGQNKDFFEIDYRYLLQNEEDFIMINGFKNFDSIKEQQVLALSNDREIKANMNGRIFMPLYQQQGNDGFFIITKISKFWLRLSKIARKLHLHHLLRLLPGIKQDSIDKYTLIVNQKTAKFLATKIFHLFGYRKKIVRDNKLHFIKRDRKIIDFNH